MLCFVKTYNLISSKSCDIEACAVFLVVFTFIQVRVTLNHEPLNQRICSQAKVACEQALQFSGWARSHMRVACKKRHECKKLSCLLVRSLLAHSRIHLIYSRQYWAQIKRSSGGRVGEENYCLRNIARSIWLNSPISYNCLQADLKVR